VQHGDLRQSRKGGGAPGASKGWAILRCWIRLRVAVDSWDGARQPSANELDGARCQGRHVARSPRS